MTNIEAGPENDDVTSSSRHDRRGEKHERFGSVWPRRSMGGGGSKTFAAISLARLILEAEPSEGGDCWLTMLKLEVGRSRTQRRSGGRAEVFGDQTHTRT